MIKNTPMKKILLLTFIISSFVINAQSLSYTDAAVLFSTDDNYGTARFTSMGGAFGALGGDMTAVDINPAGLAVYNNSEISSTLTYRETEINSSFYGSTINNRDDFFTFTQIGGVTVFNTYNNSDFKKIAIGFNYNIINDFNNNYAVEGNSGVADFVDDPYLNYDGDDTNNVYYENVENQFFVNYTSGINDRFSFSIASQYKDFLYLGASFSFQNLNFYQNTIFEEANNDGNGNTLDAIISQYLSTYGNGFNFGLGAILKPVQNLRLGISYQSPIWYNLSERFIEDIVIDVSNNPDIYTEYYDPNYFDYELKTPSKFTGSFAYIFGKSGLVSIDYIYQDYKNTILKPTSAFLDENQELSNGLRNTSSFKIGTEWRYKLLSFRGGYRVIQTPYKDSGSTYDINGYSFGLGINFNNHVKLDLAYDNSSNSDQYSFLNIDGVEPAYLDINNDRFTSTLVFSF